MAWISACVEMTGTAWVPPRDKGPPKRPQSGDCGTQVRDRMDAMEH
jgi:hypothetical protein